MAHQSDVAEIGAAWAALRDQTGQGNGWRTISVADHDTWQLIAGVRHPGGEEAILVGFAATSPVADSDLPRGGGFLVERVRKLEGARTAAAIALTREPAASLELFTAMVENVSDLLQRHGSSTPTRLLQLFISRIRAWQSFMSRPKSARMSDESELGLFGELVLLEELLNAGVTEAEAVACWQGPFDGLHDFSFEGGAIEVKTTPSSSGFSVRISSLEQLDEAIIPLLFLAGVRAVIRTGGETLPERATRLRERLPQWVQSGFDMRLLHAGYDPALANEHVRRLGCAELRLLEIGGDVPRLSRSALSPAIRAAEYVLDLDLIDVARPDLASALSQLGHAPV
ncbi:PD-(D/E)XK motif protein [Xanthobacter sp. V2C-8]|jgi:hypothetical protein|uniref:PD-(D/E)XK motif protein n=1 Tax=Xanthobacter TaxID=279 RepID=UPI00372A65B4